VNRATITGIFLLLAQLASPHDLDLTVINIVRTGSGTTITVATPLSRLVQTAGLGDRPSGPALDVAIRERLNLGTNISAHLTVDSPSDVLTWTANLQGNRETVNHRFDTSTRAARTIISTFEGHQLTSEVVLDDAESKPTAFGMLGTGVQHILSGLDHILFVIGLALLGGGRKTILKLLTAFTTAHTLTLVCTSLGWIHVNPRIVEPVIALSIVALAIEGICRKNQSPPKFELIRLAIAFGFGLVHGLGFAGGLANLGVQGNALIQSLLPFSVGIELGQILILAPTLLIIGAAARLNQDQANRFRLAASVGLGMIGCFWLMERIV